MNQEEFLKVKVEGHLRIWERETGKILLDTHNAIHPENMSAALSYSLSALSNQTEYQKECLEWICFGNGGARATSSNKYIYATPQTMGRSATLYHQTYKKNIGSGHDENNYIAVTHVLGNLYTDIMVNCLLGVDEPEDQELSNVQSGNGDIVTTYSFSEIGLMTKGNGEDTNNKLLTHLTFYPVLKASNTSLQIQYLIRVQIV